MEINGVDLECVYHNAFVQAKHSYQEAYNYLMEVIDNLNKKDAVHLKNENPWLCKDCSLITGRCKNHLKQESKGCGTSLEDGWLSCGEMECGRLRLCKKCQERHKSEEVKNGE